MKKILKETLVCVGGLSLLAALALGINGACFHETKQVPVAKEDESEFFYEDKNGVFHSDRNCIIFITGSGMIDDDTYAVKYHRKDEVSDWFAFARRKHLCVHCFNEKVLKEFNEQRVKNCSKE